MIRGVLFDAVGTLMHVRGTVGETYARFAAAHGMKLSSSVLQSAFTQALRSMPPMVFPGLTRDDVYAKERDWWRTVVRAVFAAAKATAADGVFERCFDDLFAHFGGAAAWRTDASAVPLLERLRQRGLRTGVVSNFDHRLTGLLASLDLAPLLDVIVLPADAGAAKPDARIFGLALSRLGIAADEAVYVGDDTADDIVGSTQAGMRAIDVRMLPALHSVEALLA